jgi:integrase
VKAHGAQGLKTWEERLSRLERFALHELGALSVSAVRPAHVRAVLEAAAMQGRSRTTVSHLKDDISTVLGDLWRDEVVGENVALRVVVPKSATVDDRKRVILTEAEFERFMACPYVSPELHIMPLVARAFGGMRTSDLHAWSWEHIDLVTWLDAHVPRPKTKTRDRLALPGMLVAPLQTWWDAAGQPTSGPVFPLRHGKGAGERRGKSSHAKRLRKALWLTGVRRGKTPEQCELQTDTDQTRRVDFHSLRRAFNTALADAGVNVQTAMRLAGHRNASTHMRYVLLAERLETPEAALPKLRASGLPYVVPPELLSHENLKRPQRDLNPCYRRERPMS